MIAEHNLRLHAFRQMHEMDVPSAKLRQRRIGRLRNFRSRRLEQNSPFGAQIYWLNQSIAARIAWLRPGSEYAPVWPNGIKTNFLGSPALR